MLAVVGASLGGIVLFKEVHHASQMPVVNVEFGDRPTIEFPSETAPAGLKVVELLEAMARWFAAATPSPLTITVWSGAKTPRSIQLRPSPAGQLRHRCRPGHQGWDQTVPGHNVGSRLVVSIPPEYGYGSRGVPQAGIGGEDTLVFVIDIISTR